MAFPTVPDVRTDKRVPTISQAVSNEGYINQMILPTVQVDDDTGEIGVHGNDHLRVYESVRGLYDESEHRVEFKLGDPLTYAIQYHDLDDYLPHRLVDQGRLPFNELQDSVFSLNEVRNQSRENAIAATMTSTAIMTNNTTPAKTWDDPTSVPMKDITNANRSVRQKIGRKANMVVTNQTVIEELQNHPEFIDRVVTSGTAKSITQQQVIEVLKQTFGYREILVGEGIVVTSKDGQTETTADIWNNDFIPYYVPANPSKRVTSFGYKFVPSGEKEKFFTFENANKTGLIHRVTWAEQDKILNANAAYLLKTVV